MRAPVPPHPCHPFVWSFTLFLCFKTACYWHTVELQCCVSFCCKVIVAQLSLTLCDSMDHSLPDSSVHGILQARILEWVAIPSSRGPSQLRDWTHISRVSCIADRFFTIWATRDSPGKNPRVGCHSLLQGIFLTQGLSPGLLHYMKILYHLSH